MTQDSSNFTKFDFDNDFFEVVPKANKTPQSTPQTRKPRTFKEAEQQGFDRGLLQGRSEGKQESDQTHEARYTQQAQQLEQTIQNLQTHCEEAMKELESNLLGLLRHSLTKILSHAQEHYSDEILEEHLKDIIQEARSVQNPVLTIHPDATATHKHILSTAHQHIKIESNPTLGPADCLLEWQSGGLEKSLPHLLERLDKLLLKAGAAKMKLENSPTNVATTNVKSRVEDLLGEDELVQELQENSPEDLV